MEFVFIFVVSTLIVIVPLILAAKLMMRVGNAKLFPLIFICWVLSVVALIQLSEYTLKNYLMDVTEYTEEVCTLKTTYDIKWK